jgi:hypothetical protein
MSESNPDTPPPNPWPTYVRALAVLHVLSIPIGFIGFLVLSARAGYVGAKLGRFDLEFWTMVLSSFGWMGLCPRYRRWFENWGRKRWPDGKPTPRE